MQAQKIPRKHIKFRRKVQYGEINEGAAQGRFIRIGRKDAEA